MMNRIKNLILLIFIGLILFLAQEALAASKALEIGTQGPSAAAQAQAMAALHAQLSASPRAAIRHVVTLTPDEEDILANPTVDFTGRLRVGVHHTVGRSVSSKGSDLIVTIPGAEAIRLELTQIKGTVAVFNDAGEAHEYTEDGFTHVFSGDEVRVRGTAHVAGAGAVNMESNLCSFNASCVENAACVPTIPSAIDAARNAFASILFISGRYYYICSGGLLADSDNGTEIPYFLTAHHCISTNREAKSVATDFQYVLTSCDGTSSCPSSLSMWNDTVGSTIKATGSAGDFTLLQLSENPPAGSVFLGWNSTPVAYTDGVPLFRISHPGGAPQAYSEHEVDPTAPTCQSWPRGQRIYSRDTLGATEGGSSGSPVMNAQAQVVGQLSGACGSNLNDTCDALQNATVDGAFAYYYANVQPFLGNGSPECSGNADCDDGDSCTTDTCNGGTCSNTAMSCDDGNACTDDFCNGGICGHATISCDDSNACTTDSCDQVTGCSNTPKSCDDGDACTADSCNPANGSCTSGPISCDDGVSCTVDSCDSSTGECVNTPDTSLSESSCSDGIDNDCDGMIDCNDADCASDSACTFSGSVCGNGVCEGNEEDCFTCPSDCRGTGRNNSKSCCGDGVCKNENQSNCSVDCGG